MSVQKSLMGHILIVDDDKLFRVGITSLLEQRGYSTHTADSYEAGLQIFENKANIDIVLLDHTTVSDDVHELVQSLRAIRPKTLIIGNSGADRRAEFTVAGVANYLQKPWRINDLLAITHRAIGACSECGLPLPLRLPRPNEIGDSWSCAFCGSRYHAILDETASAEIRSNALSVDQT